MSILATVDTSTASIDLPPDLLQPDAYYVFSLFATTAGGGLRAGRLRRTSGLAETAQALSSRILVSTTCGDHTVAATEQCDDGGETATCNIDCSTAHCGDGLVNATAGEQCDDGNAADGDGCSHDCHLE